MDETTEDLLLDRRVRLRQSAHGYRAGMDAALLAAACDARAGERVIEAGCGPGAVLLQAAARRPHTRFVGVERDPAALALARENIALNGLEDRAEAVGGDVAERFPRLGLAPFDAALANPPFFDDERRLRAPSPPRRAAWIADDGLGAWIGFLLKAVRERGTITLIHRADRLDDILALLAGKAGSVQVLPVHPFADAPAKRVLVRAVKTGRAPLRLLPPLILHAPGGEHSPQSQAILRGKAALNWS
ncbi:tRNA1(Val) (adenine(37)-N6)-methyltransferase [Phenylobacterium sp.]|uniref:tRNA1(Val) (adenine(37)-N6)-methyltransferase n=1 Tax=Phenylobacterium sp. TaxID=1871053 RepID=UPI0035B16ADC